MKLMPLDSYSCVSTHEREATAPLALPLNKTQMLIRLMTWSDLTPLIYAAVLPVGLAENDKRKRWEYVSRRRASADPRAIAAPK